MKTTVIPVHLSITDACKIESALQAAIFNAKEAAIASERAHMARAARERYAEADQVLELLKMFRAAVDRSCNLGLGVEI